MKRALLITGAFALLTGISIWQHEMWLDEMQAYLLARDTTLPGLFSLLHYEAHPALWHLLVKTLQLINASPIAMQVLHWCMAVSTVFIFLRFAPFSWPEKLLFVFGYFQSYEYAVISRNYALGWLCLAGAMVFIGRNRYGAAALCLSALAHSNLFGWIISLAYLISRGFEIVWHRLRRKPLPSRVSVTEYFAHAFLLLSLTLAFLSMYPAADYGFDQFAAHRADIRRTLSTLTLSFFPVFDKTIWFARSNWYHHLLSDNAALLLVPVLCIGFWHLLKNHLRALMFFFISVSGMLLFFHLFYSGQIRHHGYVFLVSIAAIWWARSQSPHYGRQVNIPQFLLLSVLAIHTVQGFAAHAEEIKRPFSRARDTAAYLARAEFQNAVIIADPDYHATAVSGYLQRPLVSSKSGRAQTYMVWNKTSYGVVSRDHVLKTAAAFADRRVIILIAGKHRADEIRGAPLKPLEAFAGGIIPNEDFYLFEYVRPTIQAMPR